MKKWMLSLPIVGLLLLLAACSGGSSATRSFRVIATAEVDDQKVEGSSVMEITYEKVEHSPIGQGGATKLKGEALILDLKGRGTVYVLPLQQDPTGSLDRVYEHGVLSSIGITHGIGSLSSQDFDLIRQARGRIPFRTKNPTLLPALVAFRDEKNPKTIYEVDRHNLGQYFPGVRFVGLDIEFIDAPVTNVLKQRLPWLENRGQVFERDPPGKQRADSDRPIGFKITRSHFFGSGSR